MDNRDFGLFAAACHDYEKVAHHSIRFVDKLDSKSFWATETPWPARADHGIRGSHPWKSVLQESGARFRGPHLHDHWD